MIEITLNGERKSLPEERTLSALCDELKLPARGVAIAVNFVLVPRQHATEVVVRDNDVVEIVTATAGG